MHKFCQCDSSLHKSDRWSGSAENNYLVKSASSVGGQYFTKKTH